MSKRHTPKKQATTSDDPEVAFLLVRAEFREAISALVDETYELMADGSTAAISSRYASLVESTAGQQGNGGRMAAKSLPPVWLPAVSLQTEIDQKVSRWIDGTDTVHRLSRLDAQDFAPEDTDTLERRARKLQKWAAEIDALLMPESVKTVSAPCPACSATHVYRQDDAGETVRQPALQIVASKGCTCLACNYSWGPEQFQLLARVLECPTPEGVLE